MEENKEEVKEEAIEPEVVETVDEGIDAILNVSLESFKEYYDGEGLKGQIKSFLIYCAIFCIFLYLFRGDKEPSVVLTQMGIICGCYAIIKVLSSLVMKFVLVPKQYKSNDINSLGVKIHVDNTGITQLYNDKEHKTVWETILLVKETDLSFMFYSNRQSGLLFSKTMFDEEGCNYIRSLASQKVNQYKDCRKTK